MRRWENNIKMYLKYIGRDGVDRIESSSELLWSR